MKKAILLLAILILIGAGCQAPESDSDAGFVDAMDFDTADQVPARTNMEPVTQTWNFPGELSEETIGNKQIRITTAKGDIVFELYNETAPLAVSNFVYLTQSGYYNNLTFHRREEGFVIQGGDPSGDGSGGPGYTFADELDDEYSYDRGIVAMANRGVNTNGSQFFIMLSDYPLPKNYTIFGKVLEGMDVVDEIQVGDVMSTVVVEDKE